MKNRGKWLFVCSVISLILSLYSCQDYGRRCYPDCSETECGPDPVCGESCVDCTGGKVCEDGLCVCSPHDSSACHDGDVWWYDSCGNLEEVRVECDHGCEDVRCKDCVPDCAGKVCGDDGCGNSCPPGCEPDLTCDEPSGQCVECTTDEQCDDGNQCTHDSCLSGECDNTEYPDGVSCSDKDPCTTDDACQDGICTGTLRDCSVIDGPCVLGTCDPDTGLCVPEPVDDGTVCDDGLYCTVSDVCIGGFCSGSQRDCDDGDQCTLDSCDDDVDVCDHELQPNPGAEGPAGDPTCGNGLDDDCDTLTDMDDPDCCQCSSDYDCDDSNPCTSVTCQQCICVADLVPDGTPCDDGLWCTVSDSCNGGTCSGSERDCNDGDFCTLDTCSEETDTCVHELQQLPGAEGPVEDPTCSNGVDDDCDGMTDREDGDCTGLTWVELPGGTFMMGSEDGESDEVPVHEVDVPSFFITKTEVTVAQFEVCVIDGACEEPSQGMDGNWNVPGREQHPVNYVDWYDAVDYCIWAGGRLPTEAEWEYAARSGGQDITYTWGDGTPHCGLANYYSCESSTSAVCSVQEGNTSQGLCDMAGNVWERLKDCYYPTYDGAPTDGSAWEESHCVERVIRGGSWTSREVYIRASNRAGLDTGSMGRGFGFRCAR